MEQSIEAVIRQTAADSNAGRIHFGEVVGSLLAVGVESYQVDYRTHRISYYLPNGDTCTLDVPAPEVAIAEDFSADGIKAAILGAQQGRVMYPEFKRLSQAAGCVAYTVWLAGRHVSYFGRKGEVHVERFPD